MSKGLLKTSVGLVAVLIPTVGGNSMTMLANVALGIRAESVNPVVRAFSGKLFLWLRRFEPLAVI